MSDHPSSPAAPKGIGSLAKKQSDVTRQGTQKLKFTPTLPVRRRKEEVKTEPTTSSLPESSSSQTRGRGRGRGTVDTAQGRGRGRGRGAPPAVEMTASGPFAMGPALAGTQPRRSATGRTEPAPIVPSPASVGAFPGESVSRITAPNLRTSVSSDVKGKGKIKEEEEMYSDPDDGVEIIDMSRIRDMDWMAPESLQEERKSERVKEILETDPKNALDLSESEDGEELEDFIEDFTAQTDLDGDHTLRQDRFYIFQFPDPFPNFTSKTTSAPTTSSTELGSAPQPESPPKKVSFAPDTKPPLTPSSSRPSTAPPEPVREEPVDGVIGQLEVYKNGAVKIRLANGILLDVNAASQPSFFQQAVYLDVKEKQLVVLGEVNKQFVVSPDVESLLQGMERADRSLPTFDGEEDLIRMDIT